MSEIINKEEKAFSFESVYSDNLPAILQGLNISLVVTSYQAQKLFFIRTKNNEVDINFKTFPRPMGLAVNEKYITLGTYNEIIRFKRNDSVIAKLDDSEEVDACFVPNVSHTTGMINIHDIGYGKDGLWVTNSAFSCLATIEPEYSFVPQWKPPFISELVPEDRCHLNGMAMLNGKPRYVTTFNQLDTPKAWREAVHDGTLIDVETGQVLFSELVMPHSPRCYQGSVYFCESGRGLIWCYDPQTEKTRCIAELPGFVRGMDFYGPLLFVGLSKIRKSEVENPIPLASKYDETFSGVWVVNLNDNQIVANLKFDGDVNQIYDVAILRDCCFPELIESKSDISSRIYHFPELVK